MNEKANMIILAPADNVGIALRDIASGSEAFDKQGRRVGASEDILQGHKIALAPIAEGQAIIRFGMPVGRATKAIDRGRLVHVHNVESQYLNNDTDYYE